MYVYAYTIHSYIKLISLLYILYIYAYDTCCDNRDVCISDVPYSVSRIPADIVEGVIRPVALVYVGEAVGCAGKNKPSLADRILVISPQLILTSRVYIRVGRGRHRGRRYQ